MFPEISARIRGDASSLLSCVRLIFLTIQCVDLSLLFCSFAVRMVCVDFIRSVVFFSYRHQLISSKLLASDLISNNGEYGIWQDVGVIRFVNTVTGRDSLKTHLMESIRLFKMFRTMLPKLVCESAQQCCRIIILSKLVYFK